MPRTPTNTGVTVVSFGDAVDWTAQSIFSPPNLQPPPEPTRPHNFQPKQRVKLISSQYIEHLISPSGMLTLGSLYVVEKFHPYEPGWLGIKVRDGLITWVHYSCLRLPIVRKLPDWF